MTKPLQVTFLGGDRGRWRVEKVKPVKGETLPHIDRLEIREGGFTPRFPCTWSLRGTTSNLRYTTEAEAKQLGDVQEGLGRRTATCAALIPIRKNEAWWSLAQNERRRIFEESSKHIAIGAEYLPEVSRRLHHARDLGEPFDFLTWFEFAAEHSGAFETMVARLRETPEWSYVDREIDIRLTRSP